MAISFSSGSIIQYSLWSLVFTPLILLPILQRLDASRSRSTATMPYPQFLLFGDSITQQSTDQRSGFGLTAALQNDYIRRLDVINRGFSGYNSAQALAMLPKMIQPFENGFNRIALVIVFFGANDACLAESDTKQHIPLDEYKENLKNIVLHPVLASHKPSILLITPPPINEYARERSAEVKGRIQVQRTAEHTKLYAEACVAVGKELNTETIDIWSVFMEKAGWKPGDPLAGSKSIPENPVLRDLMHDGLHFNAPAYKILYDEMNEAIQRRWPALAPGTLPEIFPEWESAPKE